MPDETQTTWFIDDGIPGVGQRPAWLPDKFKTVADLAKSNAELERKLGTPPDEYDFSKSKHLTPNYEPFIELGKLSKEKRVPKEVMDKMVDSLDKYIGESKVNPEVEIKKLGDNGQERLNTLDNWLTANFSKEAVQAITSTPRTADTIKALEEFRGKMMSSNPQVPTGNQGTIAGSASLDDIKMELSANLGKYKTDVDYRKDIQRRLEVAAKNAPGYVDKVGS